MEHYQNLVENLHHEANHYAVKDGFESEILRRAILSRIRNLNIPKEVPEKPTRFMTACKTERLRTEYFYLVRDISGQTAAEMILQELTERTPKFLQNLIVSGAESIGREIGGEYAGKLYPELRRLQIAGLEIEAEGKSLSAQSPIRNYGFTVLNYSNCLDISPVEISDEPPGRELFYDGINERFIEKFVFPSVEEADILHNAWEIHQKNPDRNPPLAYSFTIERDGEDAPEISSVEHADPFARSQEKTLENGIRLEIKVFPDPHQAFAERRKYLKANRERNNPAPLPKKPLPEKRLAEPSPKVKGKASPARQKANIEKDSDSRRTNIQNRRPR